MKSRQYDGTGATSRSFVANTAVHDLIGRARRLECEPNSWAIPAASAGHPAHRVSFHALAVITAAQGRMAAISVSIEADLCGPISVGTVGVIRALMAHVGLSLSEARELVDRCVFDGQRIEISVPSRAVAEALLAAWRLTPAAPRISASIAD